jgi:hypothetical protein
MKRLPPLRHKPTTPRHEGLSYLRYLKGVKKVREWLGLSLAQVGALCGVSSSEVCAWQNNTRFMPRESVVKLGKLISQRLIDDTGRTIGVKIEAHSPWRVSPWAQCRRCRAWFELRRATDRTCQDCRKE